MCVDLFICMYIGYSIVKRKRRLYESQAKSSIHTSMRTVRCGNERGQHRGDSNRQRRDRQTDRERQMDRHTDRRTDSHMSNILLTLCHSISQ